MADESDFWLVVAAILLGVLATASGLGVRAGYLRYELQDYWKSDRPAVYRNLALVQIPGGLALVLMGLAWLSWSVPDVDNSPLVLALLGSSLSCSALALVWLIDPPSFLKPRWLRDEEATRPSTVGRLERMAWQPIAWLTAAVLTLAAIAALSLGFARAFAM